jgi:ankyrin repeat protein
MSRPAFLLFLLCALFAPVITRADPAPAGSRWVFPDDTPVATVPLLRAGHILVVPIAINGKPVGHAILDTGAVGLALDFTIIDDFGLKPVVVTSGPGFGGTFKTAIYPINSLKLGAVTLEHTVAAALDLKEMAHALGIERLAGIVGIGSLPSCFSIDYRAATLTLYQGAVKDLPDSAWSTMRTTRGMPELPVSLPGRSPNWLVIDTGYVADMYWGFDFRVQHHEYLDDLPGRFRTGIGIGGTHIDLQYHLDEIELFGKRLSHPRLSVATTPGRSEFDVQAGVVGITALRRFHLYLDFPNRRLAAFPYLDASLAQWDAPDFDPAATDLAGVTPLMRAAADGLLDRMSVFLKKAPNLEAASRPGAWTALMYAADQGQSAAIDLLLKAGADVNKKTDREETALMLAIDSGIEAAALRILQASPSLANADVEGKTALARAAALGNSRLVAELLRGGAPVNAGKGDDSALHFAAQFGHLEVIDALLQAKADVSHATRDGLTPLMVACRYAHPEIASRFLQAGADVNASDKQGSCPLHFAAAGGDITIIKMLLDHGANKKALTKTLESAIDAAASEAHTAAMSLLIDWPDP